MRNRRIESKGEPAFITLHGIVAFLGGAVLAVIALIVACVQIVALIRRRELVRFFPPAIGATAVGLLCGIYLMLGAEFRWISPEILDDVALPLMIAALGWIFYNRMGSKRNRVQSP